MEVGLVVGKGGKGVFGLWFLFPHRNLVIHCDFFVFIRFFFIKLRISKKLTLFISAYFFPLPLFAII
jgi:hypothetical protein